jgi:hypothetical protein
MTMFMGKQAGDLIFYFRHVRTRPHNFCFPSCVEKTVFKRMLGGIPGYQGEEGRQENREGKEEAQNKKQDAEALRGVTASFYDNQRHIFMFHALDGCPARTVTG